MDEYLVDLNATAAAKRAGYSEKSASRIAIELLNKTHVSAAIQARRDKLRGKLEITRRRCCRSWRPSLLPTERIL